MMAKCDEAQSLSYSVKPWLLSAREAAPPSPADLLITHCSSAQAGQTGGALQWGKLLI